MQQTHAANNGPVANGALAALTHATHQLMLTADAEQLAGLFSVSHAAMVHRLHELRLYAPEDFCDSRK